MSTTTVPVPHAVSPSDVVTLQAVRAYPSVSVLMTTQPGVRMSPADASRLSQLVQRAIGRLRAEQLAGTGVADTLERLSDAAASQPTASAVALFAGPEMSSAVSLSVPVVDRVVVDPSFATRDLVRALHRTPRHVVLALTADEARLFDGGGELQPARSTLFPMQAGHGEGAVPAHWRGRGKADRPGRAGRTSRGRGDDTAFFRRVDRALHLHLRLHPAPLVLVGEERTLASFQSVWDDPGRLAGTVRGSLASAPLDELARRIDPVLREYLRSREEEALSLVDQRTGQHRVASGMRSAWSAARVQPPEMLAVEEGLFYPARVSADGDHLTPASDVEHPEVVDDAVDELIEMVLLRGGWVALVGDGGLAAHEGVALTLRT